jgi:hypothetical protein
MVGPNQVDIYDWKRAKDIHGKKYTRLLAPLEHLYATDIIKYSIQLNLYKHIIEKRYGFKVRDMYLVAFHPNYETYQKVQVKHMPDEVNALLDLHLTTLISSIDACLV